MAPLFLLQHVFSYDAIIEDAANRNHTFLEILKMILKRLKPKTTATFN